MSHPVRPRSQSGSCKIAFIGSHGVGKTTLTYGLAARLKARDVSLEVVVEVARRCPLPLNQGTTLEAQSWILHTQIADELAAAARYPVVICDRSVLDNYVYLLLSNGPEESLEALVNHATAEYDLLLHVPPTNDPPSADGTRSTDIAFRDAIDARLVAELAKRGFTALQLDPNDREHWLDAAEAAALTLIAGPQLRLL